MKRITKIMLGVVLGFVIMSCVLILWGGLAGCCIALSPDVYGPPYYTGPGSYYSGYWVVPAPVIIGPVAPMYRYYGYHGYRGSYYRHHR